MVKLVLSGAGFSELADIDIESLWVHSTPVFSGASVGVVNTGDADIVFQGTGLGAYDAHGYATTGTINKFAAVFGADGWRADWSGLSLDAGAFQHTVKTENTADFLTDLFGGNDKITMNQGGGIVSGFDGNDKMTGKNGSDGLIGADGNDVLKGGGGNDVLAGDAGRDVMTGGADFDTFAYRLASDSVTGAIDTVKDLSDVEDTIDLSSIDADTAAGGDQGFFLAASFTGVAGALILTFDAGHNRTVIEGHTDIDGTVDLTIYVTGDHSGFTNFDF